MNESVNKAEIVKVTNECVSKLSRMGYNISGLTFGQSQDRDNVLGLGKYTASINVYIEITEK